MGTYKKIITYFTSVKQIIKNIHWGCIIILAFISVQKGFAQIQSNHLTFNHFTVDDGLTLDNEAFLYRDSKGFLWISAFVVQRFDGNEFKKYTVNIDDTVSLKTRVYSTTEDSLGDLWFGALNSMARYHYTKDYFRHYNTAIDKKGNEVNFSGEIYTVFVDKHGDIWVAARGFYKYNREKDRFESVALNLPAGVNQDIILQNATYAGYHKERDEIYIGVDYTGIVIYSLKDQTSRFIEDGNDFSGPVALYQKVFVDQYGKVWFATASHGVKMYDPQVDSFTMFTPNPEQIKNKKTVNYFDIRDIGDMGDGRVAFGTDANGLNIYDPETGLFDYYTHDFRDENSISTNGVHNITRGIQNILWLWCFDGGLSYYDPSWKKFHHIRKTGKYDNELTGNAIKSFAEDNAGNYYIVTENNGLNYWYRQDNRFARVDLMHSQTNQPVVDLNVVKTDNQGNLWATSFNNGIFLKPAEADSFIHFYHTPANQSSPPRHNITGLDVDNNNRTWYGFTDDGKGRLGFFDPEKNRFEAVTRENMLTENSENIPTDRIDHVHADSKNNIWLGFSEQGITLLKPDNDGYNAKTFSPEDILDVKSIDGIQIFDFFENQHDNQMIISTSSGLIAFDYEEENFTNLAENYEILEGIVPSSILQDKQRNYWFAANNGLIKTDEDFSNKIVFTIEDGIQGTVFFPGSKHVSSQGEMLFGGNNGFNLFLPGEIKENTFLPPTYITGLKINYNEVNHFIADSILKKDVKFVDSIRLNYDQSALVFKFIGLNFTKPEMNQYRYKMQGLQDRWNDIGTQQEVSFAKLPPGKYTFMVQASNNDGKWNPTPASIYIHITPPWWGSWWFYTIIGLFVIAAIAGYLKIRENERKKDQKTLQEAIARGQNEVEEQKQIIKELEAKLEEKNKQEFELRWQNKGTVRIGEVINNSKDSLDTLLTNVNEAISEYLKVNHTAIYLKETNKNDSEKEHLVLKAITLEKYKTNIDRLSFIPGEGLVGVCFRNREIEQFDNIPNTYLENKKNENEEELLRKKYSNYLTLAPLKLDEFTEGVIEIYSGERLPEYKIDFLTKTAQDITASIISLKATANIEDILAKAEKQQKTLEEQEKALTKNLEEIKIEHEEAAKKEKTLKEALKKEKERYQQLKDKLDGTGR